MEKRIMFFKIKLYVYAFLLIAIFNAFIIWYFPQISTFHEFMIFLIVIFNEIFIGIIALTIYAIGKIKTIEENQDELMYLVSRK